MSPYTFTDGQVHQLYAAEVTSHNHTASGQLAPPQMLASRIVTWVVNELDRCFIADAVAHMGLAPMLVEATLPGPPALPGIFVDVISVDLDAEGN